MSTSTASSVGAKPLAATAVLAATGSGIWVANHRRSKAVRSWRPSPLSTRRAGALHVRTAGDAGPVTVLLHGLVATGDIFGADFDQLADAGTLVVPDLLGFGRSMDGARSTFMPDEHLDALDEALDELGLTDRPFGIGAHSMGSSIAMRWLDRRAEQITSITCFGPPIYANAADMSATIADSGLMSRAFVANTEWARTACRINCAHRTLAGVVAAAATPGLPTPIARAASLHTWPAYRDAMEHLVPKTDWERLSQRASEFGVPVTAVWGANDRIGDQHYARSLTHLECITIPEADHHLPLTHAQTCVGILAK